jgi:hypothetical protein
MAFSGPDRCATQAWRLAHHSTCGGSGLRGTATRAPLPKTRAAKAGPGPGATLMNRPFAAEMFSARK